MRRATIIRLAVLGAILPAIASAQPFLRHNWGTVADLPAVSASSPGRIFTVTDGADDSDCETGGGSESVMCRDTGISWVAVGSGGDAGTVTSVSLTAPSILSVSGSPVTTSGTLAVSLATQAANRVFAGPTTGADAAPTFRGLVSADIPNNAADTTGNASTATALAANGANCAAGLSPLGVDAGGAAEGCFDVATQAELDALDTSDDDLTDNQIGDLSDVDETGASEGDALVLNSGGTWVPVLLCQSDGTNCQAASVSFSGVGAGTNTSALLIGSGGSLKKASGSTGTIDATGVDVDGDGNREIRINGTTLEFDAGDNGSADVFVLSWGGIQVQDVQVSNEGRVSSSNQNLGLNLHTSGSAGAGVRAITTNPSAVAKISHGLITDSSDRPSVLLCDRPSAGCNQGTAANSVAWVAGVRYDSGAAALWVTDGSLGSPSSAPIAASYVVVGGLSGCRLYGSQSSPPSSPSACWQYYDSDSNTQCIYDGTVWQPAYGAGACS